jgi:hypothetical protein
MIFYIFNDNYSFVNIPSEGPTKKEYKKMFYIIIWKFNNQL